jgi:hypothetical protein
VTKVVFQDISYWLTLGFWQDCRQAGVLPFLLELRNGKSSWRNISRVELALRHSSRVAGWGHSLPKAASVLYASLTESRKAQFIASYRESLQEGLKVVSPYFTARTGAQGKIRLPADVSFVVAIHDQAKDGSPQLHAHLAIGDRVSVPGTNKTFATHKVELYQLRELFDAAVTHAYAHELCTQWGLRVSKTKDGLQLPDVPIELCRLGSLRKHQIEDYLKRQQVKSTPLSRSYAALATRQENARGHRGRQLFQMELLRHGFQGESLLHSRSQAPASREHAAEHVGHTIKNLLKVQGQFTKRELLTHCVETASPRLSLTHIQEAVETGLQKSKQLGLRTSSSRKQQTIYSPRRPNGTWRSVARRIEHLIMDRLKGRAEGSNQTGSRAQTKTQADASSQHQASDSPRWQRSVKRVLQSYQVIGAIGRQGIQFARKAIELYQEWAKPVWRVNGHGHRNSSGSVAAMVRDLKPLTRHEAHKMAIRAMWKLNGTFKQKLRYGEFVYQSARRAKYRFPKKCLIVIRDVLAANPKDVRTLLQKATKAKAKVLLVDRELSRSQLLKAAKQLRPGQWQRYPNQEMGR